MQEQKFKRSPLFYVGDKYKLMEQLSNLFPDDIKCFYDVFCGGGSASLNTLANEYKMNDIDANVMQLHRFLIEHSYDSNSLIEEFYHLIKKYNLSHSELGKSDEIEKLKKIFKKTYYSEYNKENYLKLREDYNNTKNIKLLYLLVVYGFNHMIRFNKNNKFNLPVGNVDWNKNVTKAIRDYCEWANGNDIFVTNGMDFENFVLQNNYSTGDFLYFDPPYLITFSDYNKLWNIEEETRLYNLLDELNKQNIRWGLSNMLKHKGKKNEILKKWSEKYYIYDIKSNYISKFDNTLKSDSREIYVTNFPSKLF
ncbi:Dam family site-specific DNA-(adenine-N6)-methyltransferase [Macrococcus capreoli]|uniref:Dam family site-specific DNA-(adenine-N6)-methyltransferase n=1 Tax=Macrococcus capreoli TaxID=2982690 RepID=UPI003F44040E